MPKKRQTMQTMEPPSFFSKHKIEKGVLVMVIGAIERHNLVCQVLRAMGMDPFYELDEDSYIEVIGEQFHIYLPEEDEETIVIYFEESKNPGLAADFAMRFCKVFDASGVKVRASSYTIKSDSSDLVDPLGNIDPSGEIDPSATVH